VSTSELHLGPSTSPLAVLNVVREALCGRGWTEVIDEQGRSVVVIPKEDLQNLGRLYADLGFQTSVTHGLADLAEGRVHPSEGDRSVFDALADSESFSASLARGLSDLTAGRVRTIEGKGTPG
jgi:predicted transcriptional regulator